MGRGRLRDLGITVGALPPGPHNAITDVAGVLVGQSTVIHDEPRVARTGVTVILPRGHGRPTDFPFAGYHIFNGCGEMTGLAWVHESGLLMSPIAITNTNQVGIVRDALVQYAVDRFGEMSFFYKLPVVAETWDGWLNDADAFHVTREHVYAAMDGANAGPVAEGNTGGGTGMICHDFKGGTGTASRMAETPSGRYTVGALVQSNYGGRSLFRVDGVPVGLEIGPAHTPTPWPEEPASSSIIIVLATDAPLIPLQCRRLAQRATVGLARTGGTGHNGSGDIFIAFATGNTVAFDHEGLYDIKMLPHRDMSPLFDAAAEAVEEAILNALVAAETMTGFQGRTVHALPLDELQRVLRKYRGG